MVRSSDVGSKREKACFHVETATCKREKWREKRGHVVTFAVRVFTYARMRNLFIVSTFSLPL